MTGAAGFVGSHLAQHLLDDGHTVVGVDNFFSGSPKNMATFADHPRFSFLERSILEPGLISHILGRHPDIRAVFHLAAIVSVPFSMEHPRQTHEVNHDATLRLLADSEKGGVKAFVFAGSAAEYGDQTRLPIRESFATDQTIHASSYGKAKYLASKAVSRSSIGVSLRFFNIFGPRQDPSSPYSGVVSKFILSCLNGQGPVIFGDGGQTRDFVYVSDVVRAYVLAGGLFGQAPGAFGLFNVGTGQKTRIMDLARIISEITQHPRDPEFSPSRQGDILHSVADVSKIRDRLGWRPRVSLEQGLKATIEWMRLDLARGS